MSDDKIRPVVVNELASFSPRQVREPRRVTPFVGTPLTGRSLSYYQAVEWCARQQARFKMRNFLIPTMISIEPTRPGVSDLHEPRSVTIRITIQILDRQTGQHAPLTQTEEIPSPWEFPGDLFADVVFRSIERLICHEVREAFHVDGERVFDPHVGEYGYVHESAPPEPPPGFYGAPGSYREAPDRPALRWQDLERSIEGSIGGMRFRAKSYAFPETPPGDEKP